MKHAGDCACVLLAQIDSIPIEDVDRLARLQYSIVLSVHMKLNMDVLLEKMWEYLGMVCCLVFSCCRRVMDARLYGCLSMRLLLPARVLLGGSLRFECTPRSLGLPRTFPSRSS